MSTIEELWGILKLDPGHMNLLVKEEMNIEDLAVVDEKDLQEVFRLPYSARKRILNYFKKQEPEVEKEKPKKEKKERGPLFVIESGAIQVNPNIHDYIARSPEWRAEMGGDQKSVDESIYKNWKLFCANELPGGVTERKNMSKSTMENRKRNFGI